MGPLAPGYKMTGHHLGNPRGLRHRQQSGNGALLRVSGSQVTVSTQGLDWPDCRPADRVLPASTSKRGQGARMRKGGDMSESSFQGQAGTIYTRSWEID